MQGCGSVPPYLEKNLDPVSLYWLKIPLQLFFSFNIFWPSYNIVLISQIHWLSSWKKRVGEYLWTIINNDIVNMSTPLRSVTPFFFRKSGAEPETMWLSQAGRKKERSLQSFRTKSKIVTSVIEPVPDWVEVHRETSLTWLLCPIFTLSPSICCRGKIVKPWNALEWVKWSHSQSSN